MDLIPSTNSSPGGCSAFFFYSLFSLVFCCCNSVSVCLVFVFSLFLGHPGSLSVLNNNLIGKCSCWY